MSEAITKEEAQKSQSINFLPQPDGFEPSITRRLGAEFQKKSDNERYNFVSSIDFPLEWREEFSHLMDHIKMLASVSNLQKDHASLLPKVINIINQRVATLFNKETSQETLEEAQKRCVTDFMLNIGHNPKNLIGRLTYDFFGFQDTDPQKTVRERDGISATLLSRNPYILSLRGLEPGATSSELQDLQHEVDTIGRIKKFWSTPYRTYCSDY